MPLDEDLVGHLRTLAAEAATRAYAPYSHFQVGAALLFDDGAIITGANVENASYGLTCCAERNALFRAISERGPSYKIRAVAVYHNGPQACPPCGACLQVISEFALEPCIVSFPDGAATRTVTLDDLLPIRFDQHML